MRVLQVIHDFLPRHQAGSELYCLHLSKHLRELGCELRVLYGEIDHDRKTGETREGEYEGLPFVEIVQNHDVSGVRETYRDKRVLDVIERELERWRPDVVHIHHLLGLGFPVPAMAKAAGAAVVMTLHDYWLSCARGGGQRFRGPGLLCEDVNPSLCATCLAGRHAGGARWVRRIAERIKRIGTDAKHDLRAQLPRARIATPNPDFVGPTTVTLEGRTREAILAHPPSEIAYRLRLPHRASLQGWVAIEPNCHGLVEEGVVFSVAIEGEERFQVHLNPRHRTEDRDWHAFRVNLEPWGGSTIELTLQTSVPGGARIDHATAGWASLEIVSEATDSGLTYEPSRWSKLRTVGEATLGRMFHGSYRREAEVRIAESKRLAEAVDCFLAPSPFLAERFRAYGFPAEKLIASDYGIWTPPLPHRPPVGANPGRPLRFVFVGTLVEHKGAHVAIEAFRTLPEGKATLELYGSLDEFVDYTATLRRMASHPGIAFKGRLENHRVMEILAGADALVIPSIWFENSPITIHEAFLAGVPVITSDLGGMAGLVQHGKNGFLFPVGDADALRALFAELTEHPQRLDEARPDPASVKSIERDSEWMLELYGALRNKSPWPEVIER